MRFRYGIKWTTVVMAALAMIVAVSDAEAWDEDGHAVVTLLAHDALGPEMPDWLKTPAVRARLVYLSAEPDRWRGQGSTVLNHIANPDHYMDGEMLGQFGLSFKTLPVHRRQFLDIMATHRALHPDQFDPRDVKRDRDYTRLVPGLLPYRIAEVQWKIAANWTQLKTYEQHRDRVTDTMIANVRQNIVYHMGILGHYVADGAQPLHTTEHHHGWVGPNPKKYTTDSGFHRYIDDGVVSKHRISYDDLIDRVRPPRKVSTTEFWRDICGYLAETHALVEPIYVLEKSGELNKPKGKAFIEGRLLEAGAMLAGVWKASFEGARIDSFRVNRLRERYPKKVGRRPKTPTSQPATAG